jgi:hypothetical protein
MCLFVYRLVLFIVVVFVLSSSACLFLWIEHVKSCSYVHLLFVFCVSFVGWGLNGVRLFLSSVCILYRSLCMGILFCVSLSLDWCGLYRGEFIYICLCSLLRVAFFRLFEYSLWWQYL